jgi:hypothetical protein
MIVLKPILTAQSFPLTLRNGTANKILLRKEGHEPIQMYDVISVGQAANYETITAQFDNLKEGDFYQFIVIAYDDVNDFEKRVLIDDGVFEAKECLLNTFDFEYRVICRERAFVTAQNPADYTPNNNEYIIYE